MTDFRKLSIVTEQPYWLACAKKYIGTTEFKGSKHNNTILKWWAAIKASFKDDETPWCAAFVGGVLEEVGIKSTRSAMARSYLIWGTRLEYPVEGCVVIFSRKGSITSGHVGFVTGHDKFGNLVVLGGNQGDKVCEKAFNKSRVLGYRWPANEILPSAGKPLKLITLASNELSENEA